MANQGSPVFELTLDGKSLTGDSLRHLLSVELREALDELDALTVRLVVPEDPSEVLPLCEPGVPFVVKLGYGSGTAREIHGDIIEVSHSRSTSSPWTVTLQGLDGMHRLKKKKLSKKWEGDHATVVKGIAGEVGLSADVEGVDGTGYFSMQFNRDAASLLMELAKNNNYFVRVEEGKTLRFGRKSTEYQSNAVTLTWGEDVESVNVRYSVNDIVTKVTVKGQAYLTDEWIVGEASSGDLQKVSGGKTAVDVAEGAFGAVPLLFDNAEETQQSDAKTRAVAELRQRAEGFLSGQAQCLGKPEAVAGAKLTIKGAGYPCAGDFLIKETTHTLDPGSGYRTSITFFSDSLPPK